MAARSFRAARASKWALYLLVEAVKPYRGQELPPQLLGMRVPLGTDTYDDVRASYVARLEEHDRYREIARGVAAT